MYTQKSRTQKNNSQTTKNTTTSSKEAPQSRVSFYRVTPEINEGKFFVKKAVNETLQVNAIIVCDSHCELKGNLLFKNESNKEWSKLPLSPIGNDIWTSEFIITTLENYYYTVEASIDRFATWKRDLKKRVEAMQEITLDLKLAIIFLNSWQDSVSNEDAKYLNEIISKFERLIANINTQEVLSIVDESRLTQIAYNIKDEVSYIKYEKTLKVSVEPEIANFSAWYEFFPRSTNTESGKHGTLKDCEMRLEYVANLGFNVVYFPPIHPIGFSHRKGKNNATEAQPDDVGCPWAIGASTGGHKSILPELGNFDDFASLIKKANKLNVKIALDLAYQCSPDHPYVTEHPEWFTMRIDGTIQYAENPPKKYQDIYPFDFECKDWVALWEELKSIVVFWIQKGVSIFRVDNPHTKPFPFWEWLIREVKKDYPETVFLAEAFTRPHVMQTLAKIGFSQSYTYFTWRNTKTEIQTYMNELTKTNMVNYFRPNFWTNTPDILMEMLQYGGRPAFIQKLILAGTLSSNYGVYGPVYELCEGTAKKDYPEHNSEDYLDSEKYEIRTWDLERPDSIAPIMKRINSIRKYNPAFKINNNIRFHNIENNSLLAFSKHTNDKSNIVLVIVNLDPYNKQSGNLEIPLHEWGINEWDTFQVHDLLSNARYFWQGRLNFIELDPHAIPAHVFAIKQKIKTERNFDYYD